MRKLLLMAALAALAACSHSGSGTAQEAAPQTMQVDLERYQGTWYEQARLPMFFQRKCVQSEAHYALDKHGLLDVTNRCRDKDGQWIEATAKASPVVPGRTDKFWVRFDNWFSRIAPELTKGDYWVLYHDDDYQNVVVGHPEREYLWLLSRTPEIDTRTREALLKIAQDQGYDTRELIWRQN